MAITDAYVTPQVFRDAKGLSDSSVDVVLQRQALAISRYLERKTGEVFNQSTAVEARVFFPKLNELGYHPTILDVDSIASLTGLAVKVDTDYDGDFTDETAVTASYYRALPLTAPSAGQPYRQLEATSWGSLGFWTSPYGVQVTAIFGWPAVPEAIVEATIELMDIWRMTSPRATGRINEFQQVITASRQGQGIVQELVHTYTRIPIGIG